MHRVFESLKHALARLFPAHGYLTERDEAYLAGAEDIYEYERRQNDLDGRASAGVTFPDQHSPVRFHRAICTASSSFWRADLLGSRTSSLHQ